MDPDRVVLIGESLGGYFAPRAAAFEHRLAALIADPGNPDPGAIALSRLPIRLRTLERLPARVRDVLFAAASRDPMAAWVLRRGMWTHGADSPLAYLRAVVAYRMGAKAAQITCPTLVCWAEDDSLGARARQLFDALTCRKAFVEFHSAEGAGDHCESGARSLFDQRVFDWPDTVLAEVGASTPVNT